MIKSVKPFLRVIALVLLAAMLATIFSENIEASVARLIEWFWLGGTAFLVATIANRPRTRELLVALLAAAALMQVLWSFYTWWGGGSSARLQSGTFYAPNQYGGYLVLLAPIFLSIFLLTKRPAGLLGFGAVTALAYLSIAFSGSRGAAVAALIGAAVVVSLGLGRGGPLVLLKVAIVVLVFVGLGAFFTSPAFLIGDVGHSGSLTSLQSKQQGGSETTIMRARWAQGAVAIGLEDPLTGSGPGTFGDKFFQVQNPSWQWSMYAHNQYLEAFAEGGVLLFLSFLAIPITAIVFGLRRLRSVGPVEAGWGAGLLGGLVGASSHLLVDHDWSYPAYSAAFVITAGSLLALGSQALESDHISRGFRGAVGITAALALLVASGFSLSRNLTDGVLMSGSTPLKRARVASWLAPYSAKPHLLTSDTHVGECDAKGLEQAAKSLTAAASLNKLEPLIHWKSAFVRTAQGDLHAARTSYAEALKIAPNSAEAYLRAARFELRYGTSVRAENILAQGIKRFTQSGTEYLAKPLEILQDAPRGTREDTEGASCEMTPPNLVS